MSQGINAECRVPIISFSFYLEMSRCMGERTRLTTLQLLLPILVPLSHRSIRVSRLNMGGLNLKRGLLGRNVYVGSGPLLLARLHRADRFDEVDRGAQVKRMR